MAGTASGMTAEQLHNIRTRLEMSRMIQTLCRVSLNHDGLTLTNEQLTAEIVSIREQEAALGGCDWCQSMRGVVYGA